jgi:hypothetical protein
LPYADVSDVTHRAGPVVHTYQTEIKEIPLSLSPFSFEFHRVLFFLFSYSWARKEEG